MLLAYNSYIGYSEESFKVFLKFFWSFLFFSVLYRFHYLKEFVQKGSLFYLFEQTQSNERSRCMVLSLFWVVFSEQAGSVRSHCTHLCQSFYISLRKAAQPPFLTCDVRSHCKVLSRVTRAFLVTRRAVRGAIALLWIHDKLPWNTFMFL